MHIEPYNGDYNNPPLPSGRAIFNPHPTAKAFGVLLADWLSKAFKLDPKWKNRICLGLSLTEVCDRISLLCTGIEDPIMIQADGSRFDST